MFEVLRNIGVQYCTYFKAQKSNLTRILGDDRREGVSRKNMSESLPKSRPTDNVRFWPVYSSYPHIVPLYGEDCRKQIYVFSMLEDLKRFHRIPTI